MPLLGLLDRVQNVFTTNFRIGCEINLPCGLLLTCSVWVLLSPHATREFFYLSAGDGQRPGLAKVTNVLPPGSALERQFYSMINPLYNLTREQVQELRSDPPAERHRKIVALPIMRKFLRCQWMAMYEEQMLEFLESPLFKQCSVYILGLPSPKLRLAILQARPPTPPPPAHTHTQQTELI